MNKNNNQFRCKSVQLFNLPNGNIKIIWKHPKDNIIQRIIGCVAIIYWLKSWFTIKYNVFIFSMITETVQSLMSFSFENWFDLFIFIYSFILGLFVIAFCIFTFLIWIYGVFFGIACLPNLILASGYSELILKSDKLIYLIGREPAFFVEKIPSKKKKKDINFSYKEIKSFLVSSFNKMIIGKNLAMYSKNNIQDIKLENIEEKTILLLLLNNEKFTIGKYLKKSEKEWLYKIIMQWLNDNGYNKLRSSE